MEKNKNYRITLLENPFDNEPIEFDVKVLDKNNKGDVLAIDLNCDYTEMEKKILSAINFKVLEMEEEDTPASVNKFLIDYDEELVVYDFIEDHYETCHGFLLTFKEL